MKARKIIIAFVILIAVQVQAFGQDFQYLGNEGKLTDVKAGSGISSPVTVIVIYDNYVHTEGMTPDWGYSIVIEGLEKTVLFDAGTKPDLFRANLEKSGVDASSIDLLFLSHEHMDHTGGVKAFAQFRTGIPVIIPHSFTPGVMEFLSSSGYRPLLARETAMICSNLYTSGQFDFRIPEQCLVLDTRNGLVVMTGCSHPGIVTMLKQIRQTFNKDIFAVFGGFHLMDKSDAEMEKIISGMKELGVVRCGATHCTGDKQIAMFRDAFGENFFELGAGNRIVFD